MIVILLLTGAVKKIIIIKTRNSVRLVIREQGWPTVDEAITP
jgi:hypothetical protein